MTKLEGGRNWEQRSRVFTDEELDLLLSKIEPIEFRLFIQFAYQTGCRRNEIRSMDSTELSQSKVRTKGKKYRYIQINGKAEAILMQVEKLWDYKERYVSQKFKKEARRLGIKDARFHDIRRTFGYNHIRNGVPIIEVSQLLGHSNVLITQSHYAPLLVQDLKEYSL
jgi:integrase